MNFACCVAVLLTQTAQHGMWCRKEVNYGLNVEAVRVPLRLNPESDGLVVSVALGDRTVRLLVDTGSALTVIDERLACELNLPTHSRAGAKGIGVRHVAMRLVQLKGLRIGSLPEMAPLVGVLDMSWLNRGHDPVLNSDVVGILGMDILALTGATIDYPRRALFLRDPVTWDRQRMQGEWRAVSVVRSGSPAGPVDLKLCVKGSRIVMRTGRQTGLKALAGTLNIYPYAAAGGDLLSLHGWECQPLG